MQIETEEQYEEALKLLDKIIDSDNRDLLNDLSDAIYAYEKEHVKIGKPSLWGWICFHVERIFGINLWG